jgi:hypothetical protein
MSTQKTIHFYITFTILVVRDTVDGIGVYADPMHPVGGCGQKYLRASGVHTNGRKERLLQNCQIYIYVKCRDTVKLYLLER